MRTGAARVAAMVLLAGSASACRDVGLQGNIPRAEAENRQFRYSVYEMRGGAGHGANILSYDNRSWMASDATIPAPERLMQSVGAADGTELFAPVWEQAPYARLYTRGENGHWHPVTPVI